MNYRKSEAKAAARAQFRGVGAGMDEGVADLAQRHQPDRRRQIEGARPGFPWLAALLQRHFRSHAYL